MRKILRKLIIPAGLVIGLAIGLLIKFVKLGTEATGPYAFHNSTNMVAMILAFMGAAAGAAIYAKSKLVLALWMCTIMLGVAVAWSYF